MPNHHKDRIAEDIKRELTAILRELKDPRVQGVLLTVVRIELSADASFAKVHVSAMEGIDAAKAAAKGLEAAAGHIRREIGIRLKVRKAPALKFMADDSIEYGMKIAKTLNEIQNN
jgi:ribosome-binding factor A